MLKDLKGQNLHVIQELRTLPKPPITAHLTILGIEAAHMARAGPSS